MHADTGPIAAKRFEKTFRAMGFRDFRSSRSKITGGAFKGPYKSESSLMTCEELHCSVTRMACSILSLLGSSRYTRFEILFVEADIGFLAGMSTIIRLEISITRANKACEFPPTFLPHILLCILCSSFPLGGPSENARWTLPGIHQRMIDGRPLICIRECSDGHQWPHSLVLCCGNTLFCTLAGTPLTLIFLPVRPPSWLHDKVVSAPGLPSPRRMTAGASVPGHCRSGAGLPQWWAPCAPGPAPAGRRGPYLRLRPD